MRDVVSTARTGCACRARFSSFYARAYSNLKFEFRGVLIGATEAIPCFPILVCGNKLWISCWGDNERSGIVEELFSSALFFYRTGKTIFNSSILITSQQFHILFRRHRYEMMLVHVCSSWWLRNTSSSSSSHVKWNYEGEGWKAKNVFHG